MSCMYIAEPCVHSISASCETCWQSGHADQFEVAARSVVLQKPGRWCRRLRKLQHDFLFVGHKQSGNKFDHAQMAAECNVLHVFVCARFGWLDGFPSLETYTLLHVVNWCWHGICKSRKLNCSQCCFANLADGADDCASCSMTSCL